jgi:hypothetical protein
MSGLVSVACSICNEHGHRTSKCPDLTDPLRPGFSGASGGGGHGGGDDEDEKVSFLITYTSRRNLSCKFASKIGTYTQIQFQL